MPVFPFDLDGPLTGAREGIERYARHAERPGFRITELQIGPTQKVPWHAHTDVQDTFYVLQGRIRISVRDPEEAIQLAPGETTTVRPGRPHLVALGSDIYNFIFSNIELPMSDPEGS